ncbi:MAG: VOC family protein [Planctomycetota bacterium]|nr:VOC family protein [Planctomycetota bacterium]
MTIQPFHLAVFVHDLAKAREFYSGLLGCTEGRSSETWVDFNLFGHQFVVHLNAQLDPDNLSSEVDGHDVPIPHFGVVLEWEDWQHLAARLKTHNQDFLIEPYIRFEGQVGEQATMFFLDPSGNALEFKSFRDPAKMFAS